MTHPHIQPGTVKAPHELRAVLQTMKSANRQRVNMNIWDRDIKAVEDAIETIEAIRATPAQPAGMRDALEVLRSLNLPDASGYLAASMNYGLRLKVDAAIDTLAALPAERPAVAQGEQDPCIADLEFANKANIKRAREFKAVVDWVETWVCNPVGSYSVAALDGLFAMTRDKIAALSLPSTESK